jgi:hypothetical protein
MFDLGDVVPLEFLVKDPSGTLANATTVTLTITQPDQTAAGPFTITPTTTGVYDYDFVPTQAGRHLARCVAIGANACAFTDAFDVADVDPGFVISLADAKSALGVTTSTNDEELRLYLAAITAVIERRVGPVVQATHTQICEAADTIVLHRSPVISVTSIVPTFPNAPSIYPMPTYLLENATGVLRQQPFYFSQWGFDYGFNGSFLPYYGRLTVTYVAGRQQIPAALQVAARIIVKDVWGSRRLAGPMAVNAADPEELADRIWVPEDAATLLETVSRGPRIV